MQAQINLTSSSSSQFSSEPSQLVQNFNNYLINKFDHTNRLETCIIESFKVYRESERHQCANVMLNIAFLCPEKTPVFAELCKDFGKMFEFLANFPSHFNKHVRDKLAQDFSNMKEGELFWNEAQKFGKIFENLIQYNIEDYEVVKLWIEKIFTKSKMESKFATIFLTKADDGEDGDEINNNQDYQNLKLKLMTKFPWLEQFIKTYSSDTEASDEDLSNESNQDQKRATLPIKYGTIFKKMSGNPVLYSDMKRYLNLKKKNSNVIFDQRRIKNCSVVQRKNYAKLIMDEAMNDIENSHVYTLFLKEISWTGWSMGNFLRIMLNILIVDIGDFCNKNVEVVDWDHVSKLGNFLSDLYIVEILKLILMNQWLEKLHKFSTKDKSSLALMTFLLNFEKVSDAMKRRDLKNFETNFKKVEQISITDNSSEEAKKIIQRIRRKNQSNIYIFRSGETPKVPSVATNVLQQIKLRVNEKIVLENFSTSELEDFAETCVVEVATNAESMQTILNIILEFDLMRQSFHSSAHKIFRRQLNSSLIEQFNIEDDDLDGINSIFVTENVVLSEFIAELFSANVFHKHALKELFEKILRSENFKTLFTMVRVKIEEKFTDDQFDETNIFLHQRIENFYARLKEIEIEDKEIDLMINQENQNQEMQNRESQDQEYKNCKILQQEASARTGAIPKR